MDVRHLRLIKEVAEKGSLTKAVETLYLSQSALSHQLKELESQLGAPLFHRVNKKLLLTGAGKIVLESAERILEDIERTKIAVKKYTSGDTGTVRVATECYTCYHWLPSLMIDFNREFPNIEIEICPEANVDPVKEVLAGNLDLALVNEEINNPNLRAVKLFTDEMVGLVHSNHAWTKKKYVEAKDFATETVIVHSFPVETATLFNQLLIPENVKPRKVIPMQVTEAVIEMVKAGIGVKVMARWIIEHYLHDKRLSMVRVTKKGLFRTWYAVTLNKPDTPQYLLNFTDHLRCNIAGICTPRYDRMHSGAGK